MAKFTLSKETMLEAMQSDPVREALETAARVCLGDVYAEARRDDNPRTIVSVRTSNPRVRTGTRPGGRPYADVVMDRVDGDDVDYVEHKRKIFARIAARYNTPRGG